MNDRIRNLPQYLLPQRLITRWVYGLTRMRSRWFKNALIRWFIRHFNVNMDEAQESDYRVYPHFNAFFTRALHAEARPVCQDAATACCPVDGAVSQVGRIENELIFQAKGYSYSLTALLGGDGNMSQTFYDGCFATLYLSPKDYHRIHMPLRGQLREMVHIPGKLFSVSPLTTRMVPGLFARNERVVALFDTAAGPMALVLVGAINVASIETVWAGAITPPLGKKIHRWTYSATGPESIRLEQGAEMGRFNMGSTVIVLFGPDAVVWAEGIQAEHSIRMGQPLAHLQFVKQGDPS